MSAHRLDPSILRAYDIRGVFEETLCTDDARAIGLAFISMQIERGHGDVVAVGRDGRLSSPELGDALVDGLRRGGARVVDIGCGPTPMLYFAAGEMKAGGGIQVTGSHNPPRHNGFKMMMDGRPFFGDEIVALGGLAGAGARERPGGAREERDVEGDYVERLARDARANGITAVWDCGNGAAGRVMERLADRLEGAHTVMFAEIDGTFPNHHPNPVDEGTLGSLRREVEKRRADLGIAFDGDGDRIGVIDARGRQVPGDLLTAYLAGDIAARHPGRPIVLDVKSSQLAATLIEGAGAPVDIWKTGHSHMKQRMRELGAPLAGEMSGHVFIADDYYGFDDAIYAGVRLITQMARTGCSITAFMDALPEQHATPEIRIACDDAAKFEVMQRVCAHVMATRAPGDVNDIDGVRVRTSLGWWLLRASNTEAVIVGRAEASSREGLVELKSEMRDGLAAAGIAWSGS